MSVVEFIHLLRGRRQLLLRVWGGFVVAVVVLSIAMPRKYVGEVAVVVDSTNVDPVTGTAAAALLLPSMIATQVDIIESKATALKVVDQLKLTERAEFQDGFHLFPSRVSPRDSAAETLMKHIDAQPARDSNVIRILVGNSDAEYAATLANAVAEAYIQVGTEVKMDPARRQAGWFDSQVQSLRKATEVAQQRLSAYQREHGVLRVGDDRMDVEQARLTEIGNQLVTAQSALYSARAHLAQVNRALEQGQLEQIPDILGNTLLQTMKADLVRAEGRLADTASRYDRNHPDYVHAAAEVQTLRGKFLGELETAKGSIAKQAQLAEQQELELQRGLAEQRHLILDLKRQHDELDVLGREADNAQRAYDAALLRTGQVRLAGQLDQSTVAVLDPARPPLKPARPRPLLYIALSLVLGALLGAMVVLVDETFQPRVRSAASLASAGNIRVLADIPSLGGARDWLTGLRAGRLPWSRRTAA